MKRNLILLLLIIYSCSSEIKDLPILSYKINDKGEQVNYTINYQDFKNQSGAYFDTKSIEGKVFIANFFFTRCPSICPPMRLQLIDIAKTFEENSDFIIVSHTIDPKNDSVAVLYDYSKSTGVSSEKWQFLTASEAQTKYQATQYMTNFKPNEDGTDFYHSSYVALVDKDKLIRGFYNILVPEDVDHLRDDIQQLID